ncbi:MAG TPA: M14 family zinc carboxypeptidase [Pyrinomonadaceae bacterium]|nr:M14 family zinc carboxypeptidase [Pyrinomonadaceae bacterium]
MSSEPFNTGKITVLLFVLLSMIALATKVFSQTEARNTTTAPTTSATKAKTDVNPAITPKYTTPRNALDAAYTAKIKEYTTEKYFLTELVDHLPASDTVPSPEKILGYAVGTPNKLTHVADLNKYYRALAAATPRVRIFTSKEKSEEGREQILVVVSDEANLAKLDRYKEITAKLADPRSISASEAQTLVTEGKPFYWASGSIHSPETGSPEMLMEMAYRLAVEDSPFIEAIRKNVIVMITPALEVDGRDTMVDLYNYRKANPGKPAPGLIFWGKYVAHDNNRDGLGLALALTRNQMSTFLEYHPTILHDLHESVPYLYTMTGTGPYNAWLDPLAIDEFQLLAYHEIEEMTKRGVPGVWTHGFYDGWAPNYMLYIATGANAIGRFYETFGNGGADTRERTLTANDTNRVWYRPNPPFPRVMWSMRNNVNMQQSAILFAMNFVANNTERFLNNFYLKSKRSVDKASNEGPAAYVIPGDTSRPVEAADMVNLMRLRGIEIHRAEKEFSVKDQKFPAGSYIVRMDQPYSRMADMLLDTQYYNVSDPSPYDDTGWTMGAMRNVKTVRVVDKSVLSVPMTLLKSDAKVTGQLTAGSAPIAFVINHNTDNTLATLRFRLKDVKIGAAEDSFKVGDQQFNTGSFIVKLAGNPSDVRSRLEAAVTELGLKAVGVDKLPGVKTHELAAPRIGIVHTWTNTQNDGWYRIEFDRFQIPYTYISVQVLRDTPKLRDKFDVLIFPPVGGTAQSIVNGIPMRGDPIPWKASTLTPAMANSPDQTDDIRGGIGLNGVANLQKFLEDGGLFVTVGGVSSIPIDYGITTGVSVQAADKLQARGSIYNSTFADRKSPIAYGYSEGLGIYFSQAPLFQVAAAGGPGGGFGGGGGAGGGGAGQGANRASGRGGVGDPDVIQAMPQPRPADPSDRTSADQAAADQRESLFFVPPQLRPRVILRFSSEEKNLLISGMLAGGSELVNKPAVIDVPVGRGHVVMFATNPMWRHQTQGEFFLLFNAVLNYDNLGVGRSEQGSGQRPRPSADDQ